MPIPYDIITLFPTFKCVLQCEHCGPHCGPQDRLGDFTVNDLEEVFLTGKQAGAEIINISGGEPFLLKQDLVDLVALIKRHGLLTRITTGGYWAKNRKIARRRLLPLVEAGLDQLFLSATSYHYDWMPKENTLYAAAEAIELGLKVTINVGSAKHLEVTRETLTEAFIEQELPLPEIVVSPLIPVGRAESIDKENLYTKPAETLDKPCPSVIKHPTILPNGDVVPCAGVFTRDADSFYAGNIHKNTFAEVMDNMHRSLVFLMIHSLGPYQLMRMVEHKLGRPMRSQYVNICHICHEFMGDEEAVKCVSEIGAELLGQTQVQLVEV